MTTKTTRRTFMAYAGGLTTGTLASTGLAGCSGGEMATPFDSATQLELTASEAVIAIRNGSLTAEAYMLTLLGRAESLKSLNALIAIDRDGALAAARRIDALRSAGVVLPALAGLPIVVKDNINTRNLPTTAGTQTLRRVQPQSNAPTLQKLIDAGAIVMGKANMHELVFGITSTNLASFAGPVRNPYDRNRIPGGSSGGTAASIAARIAPGGLGTDTGGSTRVPAALCGIVGLRPSVGNGGTQRRYDDTNAVVPISHTRDTVGPMARSVADIALLDAVITGRTQASPADLRSLRIGIPASFWFGLDTQVASVMNSARARLAIAGVTLVEVDLDGLMELNDRVSNQLALHEPIADIPAYLSANGVNNIDLADIAAQIASPDVKGAFGAILMDAFGSQYLDAINIFRPRMQAIYSGYFAKNRLDAVMFPTTILPAVPIDAVNGSSSISINGGPQVNEFSTFIRNTDPGSNAGIPGISLPAGMTGSGLPVGLEFDGPIGSDERLLSISLAVELLLGRLPPPVL